MKTSRFVVILIFSLLTLSIYPYSIETTVDTSHWNKYWVDTSGYTYNWVSDIQNIYEPVYDENGNIIGEKVVGTLDMGYMEEVWVTDGYFQEDWVTGETIVETEIPDSMPPEEITQYADETEEGTTFDINVETAEELPETLVQNDTIADDTLVLDTYVAQADLNTEINTEENKSIENIDCSPCAGDPVRLATGDYTTSSVDMSYPYLNSVLNVERVYLSSNNSANAFGKGWSFNFDTRIIRGVKPDAVKIADQAEGEAAEARSILKQSKIEFKTSLNDLNEIIGNYDDEVYQVYLSVYNTTMAQMYQTIELKNTKIKGTAVTWKEELETTLANLNSALKEAQYPEVKAVINGDIANAQTVLNDTILPFIERTKAAKKNLIISFNNILSVKNKVITLEKKALILKQERILADTNTYLNKHTYNDNDPQSLQMTGNQTVTLIDESGTPHLFTIEKEPDYNSTAYYSDGTINYYPAGSGTTAVQPNDEVLQLLSDGGFLLINKDNRLYYYSFYGQLTSIVDTNNNHTDFFYDSNHKLSKIIDAYGRETTFNWSGDRIISVTDPALRVFKYDYNSAGFLVKAIDPMGNVTQYLYQDGLLNERIAPDLTSEKYIYGDLNGKQVVLQTVNSEGFTEYFYYYPQDNYTIFVNSSGIIEKHFYNEINLETKIEYSDNSIVQMFYDDNNRLNKKIDENGNTFLSSYDSAGNLTSTVYPDGSIESFTYNSINKLTSFTDKMGRTTIHSYDDKGNMTQTTQPDQTIIKMEYDSKGSPTALVDPMGNRTTYTYNTAGYLYSIKAPDNSLQYFDYDNIGNLLSYIDQAGNKTTFEYDLNNNKVKAIDSLGYFETWLYNSRNDLIEKTDKKGNKTVTHYDKQQNPVKIVNPDGGTLEYRYRADGKIKEKIINGISHINYDYDIRGNLTTQTQQELKIKTTLIYDPTGNVTAQIDGEGHKTELIYNSQGLVAIVRNPDNTIKQMTYDRNGNIISITNEAYNTTLFEYDVMNRMVKATDAENNSKQIVYDNNSRVVFQIDANNNKTEYKYNSVGKLIEVINPLNYSTQFQYDLTGNLIIEIDAKGNSKQYIYDNASRIIKAIDSLNNFIEYSYDPDGNVITTKDENGNITAFEYDAMNRMAARIDPYNNKVTYSYNYLGLIEKIIDPLNNIITQEYDESGRLVKEINQIGAIKSYQYDKNNQLVKEIDELGRIKTYTYDIRGRLNAEINPLNETVGYKYDAVGNVIALIDAKKNSYKYEYDMVSRIVKEINQLGNIQGYEYDGNGNVVGKVDFNGNKTSFIYDPLNKLKTANFYDGTKKEFDYDANGNLTRAENDNKSIEFEYDTLNRLNKQNDHAVNQIVNYKYDNVGNRIETFWLNDTRKIVYNYGKLNELLKVIDPEKEITEYQYDTLGREIIRKTANGIVTETIYDQANRVIMIKNTADNTHTNERILKSYAYVYNLANERTSQIDEQGNVTAYKYDELGRIENVYYPFETNKKIEDLKERLSLGLFPDFEINSKKKKDEFNFSLPALPGYRQSEIENKIKETLNESSDLFKAYKNITKNNNGKWTIKPGEGATAFIDKLVFDTNTANTIESVFTQLNPQAKRYNFKDQSVWTESYFYDENSNRTVKANGWGQINYNYSNANELLNAGNKTYGYDLNGNLTTENLDELKAEYTYNPENRVIEIYSEIENLIHNDNHTSKKGISYEYDALGRRSASSDYQIINQFNRQWNRESNQNYLYDGLSLNLFAEFYNTSFNGYAKGKHFGNWKYAYSRLNPVSEYIYGNGKLIERIDFGKTQYWSDPRFTKAQEKGYYNQDILGSTIMVSNNRGHINQEYEYDVFGNNFEGRFNSRNDIGFNGKIIDPVSKLYNYGFRDYSAANGRFITVDPVKDGLNWFVYCGNDPVNRIDPDGLFTVILLTPNGYSDVDLQSIPPVLELKAFEANKKEGYAQYASEGLKTNFDVVTVNINNFANTLNSIDKYGTESDPVTDIILVGGHGDPKVANMGGLTPDMLNKGKVDLKDDIDVYMLTCNQGKPKIKKEWYEAFKIPSENLHAYDKEARSDTWSVLLRNLGSGKMNEKQAWGNYVQQNDTLNYQRCKE